MSQHRRTTTWPSGLRLRRRSKTGRAIVSALSALAVLAATLVPTSAAFAADEAAVRNVKTTDATVVGPGDTFNWKIEVGCSVLTDECVNAVLTDTMPDEFIVPAVGDILLTPALSASERTISITGQTIRIAFTQNLTSPAGQKGLTNGTVTVTIPVTVRSDLDYTPTPVLVENTSSMIAENAPKRDSSASVLVDVPLELDASAAKSFSPSSSISVAGLGTDITLNGANTSNANVSTLRIQDPVNPSAAGNIFTSVLGVTALGAVTWPSGATSATVSVWDSSLSTPAWVAAPPVAATDPLAFPAGVAVDNIRGVRIDFTSGVDALIPPAASASFVVAAENRTGIAAGTHPNNVQTAVFRDALSATKTATANYTVALATSAVSAGKSITPGRMSTVAYGSFDLTNGTVTLTGGNAGNIDLKSLTISEPSDPTAYNDPLNSLSPAHTGGGLIFDGFASGVSWPLGSTAADVTYYYSDGSSSNSAVSAPSALPDATVGKRVTGFRVTFTGLITEGAHATLPFAINANPAQVAPDLSVTYLNTIAVTGVDAYDTAVGPTSANDDVTVLADQINLTTTKSLSRDTLRAGAGQSTIATLTTVVSDYPETTRSVGQIEMTDPATGTGLTDWYNYFDATELLVTQVPAGATLTVLYRDSAGNYLPITVPALGPGTQNFTIPSGIRDDVYGIKLLWESSTGFQPGQTLSANVKYSLRSTLRNGGASLPNASATLQNCSASQASSDASPSAIHSPKVNASPCPEVTLEPILIGPGSGANFLDKNFINTTNTSAKDILNTRNDEQARVRLSWSTDSYDGIESMVIYDGAVDGSGNPDPGAWTKGMYDAFDLVSIPIINNALDPLIRYDRVYFELYDRTSGWVSPSSGCTMAAPCDGSLPAYALTTTERENTVAVRFVFSEGSSRTGIDPAVGSGVAESSSHNRRIDLVFQLRNELRSPLAYPVVDGYSYNAALTGADHSVIRNSAWSEATFFDTSKRSDRDEDTVELRDPLLAVSVTKSWAGGPLPIPDATVTVHPTSRVTIDAANQTVGKVDSLTISEPNRTAVAPNDSPFEQFDLAGFRTITHPSGATGLTVTVTRTTGGDLVATGTTASVRTTVLAWTSAQLADATGFVFAYTGRIDGVGSTSAAKIVFDLTLRETRRSDAGAIVAGTVYNSTDAVVADERWETTSPTDAPTFADDTLQAVNGANIALVASTISVTTSKAFALATETEPARSASRLTLTAKPGGSERVQSLTITDDRSTFWNAFDMTGIYASSLTLPTFSPTTSSSGTVIQVEACTGGTWTAAAVQLAPDATCTDRGGSWVGAGTWKTQVQARSNFLPTGVSAANVEGLRITVKRADNSQWENSQAPTISIPLQVQRRVDLRTGDPVLTNLAGNAAAPGETVPGRTSNALKAEVLGVWGKTATATNTANYLYQYATTGVRVQKTPAGVKAPGRLFDYTLSVTNTGNWPIMNPVITDYLPSDAVGAQLIFDPDKPWDYSYALTGSAPAPANGTALPVGTSGPTADVQADAYGPEKITFTFPAGSVLEVGQVYTITIPMMFRPGLVNNVDVTNTFGIRGDRKFDSCTAPAGFSASYDAGSGECSTGTTVRPSEQAALRALMTVKAELDSEFPVDQGFNGGTNADCIAAKDSAGFSRLPCIPLTLPGQLETWRLTAQNTGTTQMPRLVLATKLPDPGDRTILDSFQRNSAWTAGFADQIVANIGIPGATVTTYYTTAETLCKDVLQNPSDANRCGNDPATGWAVWTAGELADPTVVTGLQFVIDFADGNLFEPADTITIDISTRTGALSSTPGADTTANNSLSASALTRTGTTDTAVTALDYSVVSVALATGDVLLDKVITGPAASFIPDGQTFTGDLVCTSLGEETRHTFTLTADTSTVPATIPTVQFSDLPGGAECTVSETTASGQTSYTATTVIVDPLADPSALPDVVLTNDYQFGGITVSKSVTSTAAVLPTQFAFTVSCTFLGVSVPLAAGDAAFTLDALESHTITGIPANADCVVTETDQKGADTTVVTAATDSSNPGTSVAVDNAVPSATFTRISEDDIDGVTNTATFNNRFDAPAALIVKKNVLGAGGAQFGADKTFTVAVECTFGATTQYSGDVLLNAGNAWQVVLENIIAGSECTFTEADLLGADAVEITPNDGSDTTVGTVTVPGPTVGTPSPVVDIDVNNWYLTGSVEVTKVFAGDAGAIDKFARDPSPAIEFEFTLGCVRDGVAVEIPGGDVRTVTAADPVADYTGIASGADCTLTETKTGGASLTRILDPAGDPVADGTFTITVDNTVLAAADQAQPDLEVENTFRFAEVAATKSVVDAPAGSTATSRTFELTLGCTLDGRDIEAAEPAVADIRDRGTVTWTELAEGAECTLTETDNGGATRTTATLTQADGGTSSPVIGTAVVLAPLRWTGDVAPNQVTFENSFSLAYTGSDVSFGSLLLMPIGLLFGGALLLGFPALWRRRELRVAVHD